MSRFAERLVCSVGLTVSILVGLDAYGIHLRTQALIALGVGVAVIAHLLLPDDS